MKIHIDASDLKPATIDDAERAQHVLTSARLLAGTGAGAARLLICAVSSLAELSDDKQGVLETAINFLAEDLASVSPELAVRMRTVHTALGNGNGLLS